MCDRAVLLLSLRASQLIVTMLVSASFFFRGNNRISYFKSLYYLRRCHLVEVLYASQCSDARGAESVVGIPVYDRPEVTLCGRQDLQIIQELNIERIYIHWKVRGCVFLSASRRIPCPVI